MTKIFIGTSDSGDNYYYKKALLRYKYKIVTCVYKDHSEYGWKNDIDLKLRRNQIIKYFYLVSKTFFACLDFDIYHFMAGNSLLPFNLDLPILKLKGKKIIIHYKGSTLRQLDKFQKNKYNKIMAKKWGYNWFSETAKRIKYYWLNIWADKIFVSTPDLLEFAPKAKYIPDFFSKKLWNIKPKSTKHNKIIIIHAPSKPTLKGSEYIVKAIKNLKKRFNNIELFKLEKQPYREVLKEITSCDIVIDQLLIGAYGRVSIEAMALGKPVICYIRPDLKKIYPKELPIISANLDNILIKIRDLIRDRNKIRKIGKLSKIYASNYHSVEKIISEWHQIYQDLIK